MATNLPTYIPLEQAAERYNLSMKDLNAALKRGTLKAVQTPEEDVLVAVEDVQVLAERLEPAPVNPALAGRAIRATEAATKYSLNQQSLSNWAYAGYIRILERGPKLLLLDEGDVQRAADLFHRARQETGSYVRAGWVLKRTFGTTHSSSQP